MTGSEYILDRILEDAQQSAQAILEDASQQAKVLLDVAQVDAAAGSQAITEKTQTEIAERYRRAQAMQALEGRKALLTVKQALLDEAFEGARQRLLEMPKDAYMDYLLNGILSVAKGGEELQLGSHDITRLTGLLDRVNDALNVTGKASLTLANTPMDIEGGFLLKQGGVVINQSMEAVLRMAREAYQSQVAAMLFN